MNNRDLLFSSPKALVEARSNGSGARIWASDHAIPEVTMGTVNGQDQRTER